MSLIGRALTNIFLFLSRLVRPREKTGVSTQASGLFSVGPPAGLSRGHAQRPKFSRISRKVDVLHISLKVRAIVTPASGTDGFLLFRWVVIARHARLAGPRPRPQSTIS